MPLPKLKANTLAVNINVLNHHIEAQGLLYHLHEDVVFYLGLHLHETHQAEYRDAEHLVHELYFDPVVGRILLRDVVRQTNPLKDQIYAGTKSYQRIVEENE